MAWCLRIFWLMVLALSCVELAHAGGVAGSPSQPPDTKARTVDGKQFISWKEHRIDDSDLAGVGIGGSDGLAIADFDSDGRMDVVAVHENCGNPVRISFGTKSPTKWASYTLSPSEAAKSQSETVVRGAEDVVTGDVNGDGRPDIVACGEAGAILYFEAPELPREMADWKRIAVVKPPQQKNSWIRVDLGDLDGDGRLEILGANKGGTDWVAFRCDGQAADPDAWNKFVIGRTRMPINVRAVDIDRDGDLDVLGGSRGEKKIVLFENLGNDRKWSEKWESRTLLEGRLTLPTPGAISIGDEDVGVSKPWKWGSSGFMMDFADLDGDGRTDIVTETKHSGGLFWLKQPEKLNGEWMAKYVGHILPDHATGLRLADINGDGRLDLFVGAYNYTQRRVDSQVVVRPGTPCGRLAWFEQVADPAQPWVRHDISRRAQGMYDMFCDCDVNGDGLVDFITTRGNSRPLDGVIWLEQVRTEKPTPAFTAAWPPDQQSQQQPIPVDH